MSPSLFLCGLAPSVRQFVGIDIAVQNEQLVGALAPTGVSVTYIEGSSRDETVRRELEATLDGAPLDILFIDGDHSYEGARTDLETYRHLVRPGGLIVFHDIVRDHAERFGTGGSRWAGGVPILWQEIRDQFPNHEFVQSWDQDGLGIGVIEHDPSVALPAPDAPA